MIDLNLFKTIGYAILQLPELLASMYSTTRKIFLRYSSLSPHSSSSQIRQKIINSGKQIEKSLGEYENKKFSVNTAQLMEESRFAGENELEKHDQSIMDRVKRHDLQFEKMDQKLENILSLLNST